MVGRIVHLNEIERVINTQDAQLTPCFFTQQSTNQQKGWDERVY